MRFNIISDAFFFTYFVKFFLIPFNRQHVIQPPFLSAVENGKRNVPGEWIDKISAHYNMTAEERSELEQAAEESKTHYKVVTTSAGAHQRKAAMQFARSFDEMDDETAIKIVELLSKTEDKN
jgi:hypothetical protein